MGAVWRDDRNGPRRTPAATDSFPWPAPATSRAQPAPLDPGAAPGQIYERPPAGAICRQKSGRGTTAQVLGSRSPDHPDIPATGDGLEVGWERNAPYHHHQSGLRVHRRNGGAQVQHVPVDRGVVDYLGREHFRNGEPDAAIGPVCAYCFTPFTPSTRGGRNHQKYCSAPCRKKGSAANLAAAAKIT